MTTEFPVNFLLQVKKAADPAKNKRLDVNIAAHYFNENIGYFSTIPGYINPRFIAITLDYFKEELTVAEICAKYKITQVYLESIIYFTVHKLAAPAIVDYLFIGEKLMSEAANRQTAINKIKAAKREEIRQYIHERGLLLQDCSPADRQRVDKFEFVDFGFKVSTLCIIMDHEITKPSELLPLTTEHLKGLGIDNETSKEIITKVTDFFGKETADA